MGGVGPVRAGIVGYGNLGASVERVLGAQEDMDLVAVFSRRSGVPTAAPQYPLDQLPSHAGEIDVLFICMGSATDVPEQAPAMARLLTTVDTYDNHRDIPRHRRAMDEAARAGGNVAIVSTGWDPGLFSLNRALASAFLPGSGQHTFWGPGLSQGHSDALRRIDGVRRAVQYTIPSPEAVLAAQEGRAGALGAKATHARQCWVVADEAHHSRIEREIRTMPDYFVGYEVEVHFIDDDEFDRDHAGMPHGGRVITSGQVEGPAGISRHVIEFSLELERNPDFTAAVQVAYGRAAARLAAAGRVGAFTTLEVPPYLLSPTPLDELIARDV
ncbi:MAG TPA: diaminopimelate dehydrogenase [Actinomycetaceae bacterium]|nr:diaminopimelate dehydrogenase [Actinomycetaceae bacterium]